MNLPFTTEQFLQLFADYNNAIGPAPIIGYLLALVALVAIFLKKPWASRYTSTVLGAMWIWNGAIYQIAFFATINPIARVFGGLMILEGLFLIGCGLIRRRLDFRFGSSIQSYFAYGLILYSMVIYSLIGMALGHGYPHSPVFSVAPCPTTIFTFGMLLLIVRPIPWHIVVIPVLWALIGSTAAIKLGIREDTALLVGLLIPLWFWRVNRSKTTDSIVNKGLK